MEKIELSKLPITLLFLTLLASSFAQAEKELTLEQLVLDQGVPTGIGLHEIDMGVRIRNDALAEKIQNKFDLAFPAAANCECYALNKKCSLFGVRYQTNGRYSIAVYTKRGGLVYAVMAILECGLPNQYRKTIKSNFVDYAMTNMVKVTSGTNIRYMVQLKSPEDLIVVCVENGFLEVIKTYPVHHTKK
jgi:hypothetical protein